MPSNVKADVLARCAAEKMGDSKTMSISHLKIRISEKFRREKDAWHKIPGHHGTEEIPPPPPKKSCLDCVRNSLARTVAQIRTGHWESAVYLKRVHKMAEVKCWFCRPTARVARSHVLLHCPNARLRAVRAKVWEGMNPGGVRVLLANPRWERRLVKFLELSGVGRVVADGTDGDGAYATRMGQWIAWETVETAPRGEG
jgi:hypothetical protein